MASTIEIGGIAAPNPGIPDESQFGPQPNEHSELTAAEQVDGQFGPQTDEDSEIAVAEQVNTEPLVEHTLADGRKFVGTREEAATQCPVLIEMNSKDRQATLDGAELAHRIAERGRAKRLAEQQKPEGGASPKPAAKTAQTHDKSLKTHKEKAQARNADSSNIAISATQDSPTSAYKHSKLGVDATKIEAKEIAPGGIDHQRRAAKTEATQTHEIINKESQPTRETVDIPGAHKAANNLVDMMREADTPVQPRSTDAIEAVIRTQPTPKNVPNQAPSPAILPIAKTQKSESRPIIAVKHTAEDKVLIKPKVKDKAEPITYVTPKGKDTVKPRAIKPKDRLIPVSKATIETTPTPTVPLHETVPIEASEFSAINNNTRIGEEAAEAPYDFRLISAEDSAEESDLNELLPGLAEAYFEPAVGGEEAAGISLEPGSINQLNTDTIEIDANDTQSTSELPKTSIQEELASYIENLEPDKSEAAKQALQAFIETTKSDQETEDNTTHNESRVITAEQEETLVNLLESLGLSYEAEQMKILVRSILKLDITTGAEEEERLTLDQLNNMGTREYKSASVYSVFASLVQIIKKQANLHMQIGRYATSVSFV